MRFAVERKFLVSTYEEIELNPEDFLHCSTIEELNDEVSDYIHGSTEHPTHPGFESSEELGTHYWDTFYDTGEKSFYLEWQRLKGLPQEL